MYSTDPLVMSLSSPLAQESLGTDNQMTLNKAYRVKSRIVCVIDDLTIIRFWETAHLPLP